MCVALTEKGVIFINTTDQLVVGFLLTPYSVWTHIHQLPFAFEESEGERNLSEGEETDLLVVLVVIVYFTGPLNRRTCWWCVLEQISPSF